jgi:hypothetical protein
MKSGEVGMFEKRGGRGRRHASPGNALSRQGMYLSQNLNRSYYSMKNKEIIYLVQIAFLICTARWPNSKDWELWGRYRCGPR